MLEGAETEKPEPEQRRSEVGSRIPAALKLQNRKIRMPRAAVTRSPARGILRAAAARPLRDYLCAVAARPRRSLFKKPRLHFIILNHSTALKKIHVPGVTACSCPAIVITRVNRRFDFVAPLIALQLPVRADSTVAGAIEQEKPAEAFVGKRETEIFS